jgi:Protein of unknown function (DUF3606)
MPLAAPKNPGDVPAPLGLRRGGPAAARQKRRAWERGSCTPGTLAARSARMADDKVKRRPTDISKINVEDEAEVRYWSDALGVSEALLRELVSRVGSSASAVRRRLGI